MTHCPRKTIVECCRHFYSLGWVSGTGGGMAIRQDDRVYMAPSGVQKERMRPEDLFVLNRHREVLERPANDALKLSACAPLFFSAFDLRDAGAVIHSHSMNAMLATLAGPGEATPDTFRVTHLEMMKGIDGTGYHDELVVPIIENTAHECDLAESMVEAIRGYPRAQAVLVQRHGLYVWGRDWAHAKTQAECYDYLFEASVKMKQLGIDPAKVPSDAGRCADADHGVNDDVAAARAAE